ncbi:Ig-like domain-containing protein [Brevibacillus parabrevis]|uniref:Ig-like domain-containing protein n=1 Tax=Brevibacillus parabrevis TaxID=54914 RepID=UPI0028D577A1|nr:Ig-like domain-containing protein [Brevibacillus parabrevis]
MKKMLSRLLSMLLVFSLVQPMVLPERVAVAKVEDPFQIVVDEDFFVDPMSGYPYGEADGLGGNNRVFVGYDAAFGPADAAMKFHLGPDKVDFGRKIEYARLKLFLTRVDRAGGEPFLDLYGVDNDSWTERDMTLPATGASLGKAPASGSSLQKDSWVSFDVTDYIKLQSNDKVASFVLKGAQTAAPIPNAQVQVLFYDKASNNLPLLPRLEIKYVDNSPPTDISLSKQSVKENLPPNTLVGTLSATDPDSEDQGNLTFELAGGDQSAFKLLDNNLYTTQPFDYEARSSYSVSIKVSDPSGGSFTKAFTIQIEDVQEPPASAELKVNGGMLVTGSSQVNLQATVVDPDTGKPLEVRFSNASDQWTEDWKPYNAATSYNWTLTAGDGAKTVYMQARDEAHNQISASANITLDTTPPVVSGVSNNGSYSQAVTITFNEGTATLDGAVFVGGGTVTADGDHTLVVTDMAGNTTTIRFFLDTTPPTGTLVIENGKTFTTTRDVALTITGTDGAGSGQIQMSFSNDGTTWSTWEQLAATKAWELAAGDGNKTVYMKLKDGQEHEQQYSDSITLDTVPPVATMSIKGTNAGNTATSTAAVKLLFEATDANGPVEVSLSNTDGVFADGWQPVQPEMSWTLTNGDGTKTVYAKFRDQAGHETSKSASILLDTVPPVVTGVAANQISKQAVTVQFSEGTALLNGQPFSGGDTISQDGAYTLVVTDEAGNVTTLSFTVDQTKPQGTMTIGNGDTHTNQSQVSLQLNVTDLTSMTTVYSNDGANWSLPEPYASTKTWTLAPGDGEKRVTANITDAAGNTATLEATIIVDQTAPTGSFTINDGASVTNAKQVALKLQYADADDQLQMRFSPTGSGDWSGWEAVQETKSWTLSDGDGAKTVFLQIRDRAGNVLDLQKSITLDATAPVVTGVDDEGVYNSDRLITFTEGTATLNGAPFASGTTVTEQGNYTLVVTDEAGNKTTVVFSIDKTPLFGAFSINEDAPFTTSRDVTLHVNTSKSAADTSMSFSMDGTIWSVPEPFARTKAWQLPVGDGVKTVYVKLLHKSGYIANMKDEITLDTTLPSGSLSINGGASVTQDQTVNLTVTATDANGPVQVRFANESNAWSAWNDAVSTQTWMLSANDGQKTVHMQMRDKAGNVADVSANIELDMEAPVVSGVENGKSYKDDVQITFNEGTATLDGQPFTSGTTVSSEGEHELVVTDAAGHVTRIAFTIDKTAPQGTFAINSGAQTSSSVYVTLNVTATDSLGTVEMRFANENESWSDWQQVAASTSWRLAYGNGMKKVLLQLRDEAHNTTELEAQIRLSVYQPPSAVKVTGVELDVRQLVLKAGETHELKAVIQPENATDKRVKWESSDRAVAEVNEQGKVVAVAPGTARITVTTADGGYTATADVTVKATVSDVLQASQKAFRLKPKERQSFQIFKVDGAKKVDITMDEAVEYSTENDLVTVTAGEIQAGSKTGKDIITVSYEGQELHIPVAIASGTDARIKLLTRSEGVLEVDEERQLELVVLDGDETEDITEQANWISSDPEVVEVTEEGKLIAKATGTAVISGKVDKSKFRVRLMVVDEKIPVRLEATPSYVRLKEGQEKPITLIGTYSKSYTDLIAEEVEWAVENPEIAEVVDGNVVAKQAGKTAIIVSYKGKTTKITVEVRQ